MIANNIAAFNEGRFHRNIVTIPQVRDSDDLNPYSMLTRAQARRKSGEMKSTSTAAINAAARVFITNRTLKSSRRSIQCHGMKQESMRQLRYQLTVSLPLLLLLFRELHNNSRSNLATPTIIKSNPVFQYAADESIPELTSGKGRSREEDMKQAILELAQLGI